MPRSNSVHVTGQMANASSSVKQDLETAIQTCKDLQQLAKAAGSNGGTVPNGVKVRVLPTKRILGTWISPVMHWNATCVSVDVASHPVGRL